MLGKFDSHFTGERLRETLGGENFCELIEFMVWHCFEFPGLFCDIGLLGMIAVRRTGTRLEWNNDAMKFTNDTEANTLLTPEYREGWSL
jgi:hypothetical protein